jgi:hypothetical protein
VRDVFLRYHESASSLLYLEVARTHFPFPTGYWLLATGY